MEASPEPKTIDPAELAWRDDLTGAWNRRYLRRLLDDDWGELVAREGTVTLLALDLDFFKEVNDAHGHLAGDRVLHWAANQLRASFRAEDRLIRHGGDEFVVALFGVGAEEARALAERARSALQSVEIRDSGSGEALSLPLSFSMGVASFPVDGTTGEEILAVADHRLYEEKRARRPAAPPSERGRRRLVAAASLALFVLAGAAWIEWRRVRRAPPPPPAAAGTLSAAPGSAPPAEIVVRDEAELARLRDEVRRLQSALAETRPTDDRERYEARISELEARLAEAGDESPAAAAAPGGQAAESSAQGGPAGNAVGGTGAASGEADASTGMRIGERRTRENLELAPEAPAPSAHSAGVAPAAAAGVTGGSGAAGSGPVVEPPQLLRAIRPDYPRAARERRRMATIELRVRVDAAGRVLAVEPVGPPAGFGFDESAREAALSARFRPGRRDGVAVEMETRITVRFLLEGPPR